MMNKQKTSNVWRWKAAAFLPLLALLLMAFGRTGENVPPVQNLLPIEVFASPQDSIKQWSEMDFKTLPVNGVEKFFFEGKNSISILMNSTGKVMTNGKLISINDIHDTIINYFDYSFTESGFRKKINAEVQLINGKKVSCSRWNIILRKDIATNPDNYPKLLNVVGNTILEIRGKYANQIFSKPYQKLSLNQRNEIDKVVPLEVYIAVPMQIGKVAPPPPPPPPPVVKNLGFQITLDRDEIRMKGRSYSMDELVKTLKEINPKEEFIKIDTHSSSNKDLIDKIKGMLEEQNITYQINWSK